MRLMVDKFDKDSLKYGLPLPFPKNRILPDRGYCLLVKSAKLPGNYADLESNLAPFSRARG